MVEIKFMLNGAIHLGATRLLNVSQRIWHVSLVAMTVTCQ